MITTIGFWVFIGYVVTGWTVATIHAMRSDD